MTLIETVQTNLWEDDLGRVEASEDKRRRRRRDNELSGSHHPAGDRIECLVTPER